MHETFRLNDVQGHTMQATNLPLQLCPQYLITSYYDVMNHHHYLMT